MPRRTLVVLLTALAWLSAAGTASAAWKLTSADYFLGSSLNTANWSVYNGPGNQSNGVRRPSQVAVVNGNLVITARMINGVIHSGGLSHRTNQAYGRFEFAVRTDPDPSRATSAAVMTWPEAGNYLKNGENDIYETGSYANRKPFYSFIHVGSGQYNVVHDADGTAWHTMAMEWEPGRIRIYRDGKLIRSMGPEGIPTARHHMAIQLDAVRPTMTGTVRMYVAWVRIYKRV